MRFHPFQPTMLPRRSGLARLFAVMLACLLGVLFVTRPLLAGRQDGLPPADDLDRSTPQRTLRLFIDESRAERYDRAAYALDLSSITPAAQPIKGPALARQLKIVLDRKLWIVWEQISDDPAANPADGATIEQIGKIAVGGATIPITLVRVPGPQGGPIWLISRSTVAAIPTLYDAHGPGVIEERLPPMFRNVRFLEIALWQWIGLLLIPLLGWIGGILLARLTLGTAGRLVRRTETTWDDKLIEQVRNPLRLLIMLALVAGQVRLLRLSVPAQEVVDGILQTLFIAAVAWLVTRLVRLGSHLVQDRMAAGRGDEAASRGDKTRVVMLQRIVIAAIAMIAISLVLLQFNVVRKVGVSLLASAGIAGVVLGFAAQKSIATLLAGVQLSISENVRIGDTVIVEGEWGSIEEITLTYVVVKIWDLRRLVIPITYFLEKPFQNWTKVSPELLGTIVVHADYTVPVDKVREEVQRICKASPHWDGKAAGLIIVEATAETVALRALISADNASKQWDLRCEVREGMVKFLQQLEGGRYLPRSRVMLTGWDAEGRAGGSKAPAAT